MAAKDIVNWASSTGQTDTDIVNAAVKQNGEEKGVEDGNEGGDSSQHCQ